MGVARPSAIWPKRSADGAAGVLTTTLRKKNRKLNQHAAVKSFKKWPTP